MLRLINHCQVAEPIALELRQPTQNIYLHTQIFTGLMYIAAALCMWFLRAWKMGEIEIIAAAEGKSTAEISVGATEPIDKSPKGQAEPTSGVLGRLFAWRKV